MVQTDLHQYRMGPLGTHSVTSPAYLLRAMFSCVFGLFSNS